MDDFENKLEDKKEAKVIRFENNLKELLLRPSRIDLYDFGEMLI